MRFSETSRTVARYVPLACEPLILAQARKQKYSRDTFVSDLLGCVTDICGMKDFLT